MNLINVTEIMGFYLNHIQNFHNNILNVFIAYREFIYYKDSEMHNMNIFDYLYFAELEFYENFVSDLNYKGIYSNYINGLNNVFLEIQQGNLFIDNTVNKLSNIGISAYYIETVASLGFYNFASFCLEEIRIKANYVISNDKNKNINFNNANLQEYDNRTIDMFNNQGIHGDINFILIHIILPFIDEERKLIINKIIEHINSKYQIYIIALIAYFLIILAFNLFFFRPIINKTNKVIYKSKRMLRIIPVEILEAQTNIKNILGVSDLNN